MWTRGGRRVIRNNEAVYDQNRNLTLLQNKTKWETIQERCLTDQPPNNSKDFLVPKSYFSCPIR